LKAELTFSPEIIKSIAFEVAEILKPMLLNGKHEADDEILDIDEAARILKVSKGQIYQWTNKAKHRLGNFPYFKTGKQLRFSRKELIEWLKSNKNG
jgi:excisionase family DNA binding protein